MSNFDDVWRATSQSAFEVRDTESGIVLGRIHGTDADLASFRLGAFVNGGVLSYVQIVDFTGLAFFEDTPTKDTLVDEATAFHAQPAGSCCGFGYPFSDVGDPTGDGLTDVLVLGGGAWLLDGSLLGQDEGITAAVAVDIAGYESRFAGGPVGDITGDGRDDFSTGFVDNDHLAGGIQIIDGATLEATAELHTANSGYLGEAVAWLGRDDSAPGAERLAVFVAQNSDASWGGDEVWIVQGPLCGANYDIQDIGAQMVSPYPFWSTEIVGSAHWVVALDLLNPGTLLYAPTP